MRKLMVFLLCGVFISPFILPADEVLSRGSSSSSSSSSSSGSKSSSSSSTSSYSSSKSSSSSSKSSSSTGKSSGSTIKSTKPTSGVTSSRQGTIKKKVDDDDDDDQQIEEEETTEEPAEETNEKEDNINHAALLGLVSGSIMPYPLQTDQVYRTVIWDDPKIDHDTYFSVDKDGTIIDLEEDKPEGATIIDVPYKFDPKPYEKEFDLHNLPTNQIYLAYLDYLANLPNHNSLYMYLWLRPDGTIQWLPQYEVLEKELPIQRVSDVLLPDGTLKTLGDEMALHVFQKNKVYRKSINEIPRFFLFDQEESVQLIGRNDRKNYEVLEYDQMIDPSAANLMEEIREKFKKSGVQTGFTYQMTVNNVPRYFYFSADHSIAFYKSNSSGLVLDFEQTVQKIQEDEQKKLEQDKSTKWFIVGYMIFSFFVATPYIFWLMVRDKKEEKTPKVIRKRKMQRTERTQFISLVPQTNEITEDKKSEGGLFQQFDSRGDEARKEEPKSPGNGLFSQFNSSERKQ